VSSQNAQVSPGANPVPASAERAEALARKMGTAENARAHAAFLRRWVAGKDGDETVTMDVNTVVSECWRLEALADALDAERLRQHTGAEADASEKLDALRRWVAEFAEPALKTLDVVRTLLDERDAIYAEVGNPAGSPFPNLIPIMDVRAALSAQAQPTASREQEA